MEDEFHFSTSHIGSLPHMDSAAESIKVLFPPWIYLPGRNSRSRTFKENKCTSSSARRCPG